MKVYMRIPTLLINIFGVNNHGKANLKVENKKLNISGYIYSEKLPVRVLIFKYFVSRWVI